ncbi:cupin domain-containing protein [Paenibacillus sediminis]|uniref:Oxalate decarboxylase/phosphoglucose isomerase-like protein (Cupin superfamily) n=1 Tax=Paenibacillus sediminis TaxID=664909 RepID=A0ABS4H371_9BACL|nr:cupin domain-containing protein [Paenibacillus sediminis]MBP1936822.1 oxalate decarboxylase/phosphoglucose isomerase-like protein (cupin superfamily) [Paenibacillus sediminis]
MAGSNNVTGKMAHGSPNFLSSGAPNLMFEVKSNTLYRRDEKNVAYEVTSTQLPAMQGVALADLFLTKNHIREPHWHPNAGELDYIISGEVIVAVFDPFSLQLLTYSAKPGQVVFIPMGWWHWITAVSDEAHLIVIFNNSLPESIEGSDVLRFTPTHVFQLAYSVNPQQMKQALSPIQQSVVIGPVKPDHSKTAENKNSLDTLKVTAQIGSATFRKG